MHIYSSPHTPTGSRYKTSVESIVGVLHSSNVSWKTRTAEEPRVKINTASEAAGVFITQRHDQQRSLWQWAALFEKKPWPRLLIRNEALQHSKPIIHRDNVPTQRPITLPPSSKAAAEAPWQPQSQSGPTGHLKTRLKITGVQTNLCTCLAPNLRGIVLNVSHGSQSVRLAWSRAALASPMEQSIQL